MSGVDKASNNIRTLQLGQEWFPEQQDGGLNRIYYDLVRYLPQVGVDVQGLVASHPEVARTSGGSVQSFAPSSAPLFKRCWGVRRAVRLALARDEFALVVSHFALYTLPVLDLVRSRPLVVHFHGPWALEGQVEGDRKLETTVKELLERAVYHCGSSFIVLSHAFGDILHRNYRVPVEQIRVVPGGVDVDRFATDLTRLEARERLGWPQNRPIIFAVRRLIERVGLKLMITAVKEVSRRVPEVLLLVAGKGPLGEKLWEQVRVLGLHNNVRLLGFVPDESLALSYRAADLTVVPTVELEGFGLVTIESLAAGTPVLVTPVGGLPEVVRDLSPELVLAKADVEALAEGLRMALTGELALPSASACQAYARTRYDWRVIAARVREVYEEALEET